MEMKVIKGKAMTFIKKYRYVAIVLLVGIILMGLPERKEVKNATEDQITTHQIPPLSYEEDLEQILEAINGVGEARVLLTTEAGTENVYQTDRDATQSNTDQSNREQTVIISGSDRQQSGLLRYQNSPEYRGAIVVCQGGDQPSVQLAVTSAVSRATGLRSDQICVLKMK